MATFKHGYDEFTRKIAAINLNVSNSQDQTTVEKLTGYQQELENVANLPDAFRAERENASIALHNDRELLSLPKLMENVQQHRSRWEERNFVLRECYKKYEEKLVPVSVKGEVRFFGLIGPQGFGKTSLLRYIHAKYACVGDKLVIHCSKINLVDSNGEMNSESIWCRDVREMFYFACAIRKLDYMDFSMHTKWLPLIRAISNYAEERGLTLLFIFDQLKASASLTVFFDGLAQGFRYATRPHTVIMSSSTSHTPKEVFSPHVREHVRFQEATTQSEAEKLGKIFSVPAEPLVSISFLEAIRVAGGDIPTSIAQEASAYVNKWLREASDAVKAEHMFVCHTVLSNDTVDDDSIVLSPRVDSD